jgi:4-amino-4-deoxy-L-arabinose transferase-like glycosyltransferase
MTTDATAGSAGAGRLSPARWAAWAGLLLLVGLVGLGAAPLFDVDEGAFAEATRELLASGDWSRTTLNGEPRWDKPILTYWLQALAVMTFGLNEFALRLPSLLASGVWVVAVVAFARPRWGDDAALGAGAVLASGVGVAIIGRAATADALLNLWLALAGLDLWCHLEAPPGSAAARRPLRRAALWIGLGGLTKGPIALLVPGAAVGLAILAGPARRARLRALLGDAPAWGVLLAVVLPWYGWTLWQHGPAFIDGFFIRHNLARFGSPLEGHGGSIGYYVVVLPLLMLPWTPLLLVLTRGRTLWREPLARYLLGWAAFVLAFFSLSGTKLPHYALYGLTPLALLAGRTWTDGTLPGGVWLRTLQHALLIGLPLAGVVVTALVLGQAPRIDSPLYRALLSTPAEMSWLTGSAALASLGAALSLARPGARWREPTALAAAAGIGLLWFHTALAPWWGERLQGPVRDLARQARAQAPDTPAVQWGLHQPSFAVYLDREAPRRAPRPGELALVRTDQLDRLAADAGGRWTGLAEAPGLRLIRWDGP